MSSHYDVLILGAGMAGLSCARRLHNEGKKVLLLEKARGLGGRMACRRTEKGAWDHGAQYFTASDADFAAQVAAWQQVGCVAEWDAKIQAWDGQRFTKPSKMQRWVGVPAMNSPLHALADGLDILFDVKAESLAQQDGLWQLKAGDQSWQAKQVVLTTPPEQLSSLLPAEHALTTLAASCQMEPCWALLIHSARAIDLPFDGLFINQGPFTWLAKNTSKPGRGSEENWVAHASPAWSREHLDLTPDKACAMLTRAFGDVFHDMPLEHLPVFKLLKMSAHRWRFASGALAEGTMPYAVSADGLALAGDWLAGGKVEGAYRSGFALAGALLAACRT
ncbi:FAD-dependent oxidoreductase [Iodobacter sp. CM08]|uniref:NAD(P)/FAD-dependent oxidoreductase n=1 Tax=Iodobacter sp. CM08 TaxID=3085902 RepID=UPI00298147C2|nr:FAD-dependent oxidoreductase [Iodobacter sp. CM08]MDW5417161.1 FAD-dependent oxidoreductase [Iodobacter sp. CM08]